jgi:prephenate dehydrogenase
MAVDSCFSGLKKPTGLTSQYDFGKLKVTIIGLGLIGGSLARALNERLGIQDITAINRSMESVNKAVLDGCVKRGFNELNEYVWESDIIFICTPVKRAIDYIETISKNAKPGCIITDVGSTKQEIIEYINSMNNPPCFIGGHPMAGTEKTGYSSGFVHLFENAFYILSPSKSSTNEAIALLYNIVEGIGALPVVLDACEHDKITGCISHVPHIIASALVNMVKCSDTPDGKMQLLAAGGFRDITRIASSSPEMWENIVLSNKKQIEGILDDYVKVIYMFKENLQNEDSDKILTFFESAKKYRDSFSTANKGLIAPQYELIVDVVDKPGIIGEIATILGSNGVNIKNINVSNSREFEQGCLRITLPDSDSAKIAFDLLQKRGYKVYDTLI